MLMIFLSALALAGTCGTVDLRPQLGRVRDQGQTSWCASHASADLLTQATGRRISAADLATTFAIGNADALWNSRDAGVQWYLAGHRAEIALHIAQNREEAKKSYWVPNILTEKGIYDVGANEDAVILMSSLKGLCLDENLPSGAENYKNYLYNIRRSYQSDVTDVSREGQKMIDHFAQWIDRRCGERFYPARTILPAAYYLAKSFPNFLENIRRGVYTQRRVNEDIFRQVDLALDRGRAVSISFNVNQLLTLEPGDDPNDGDHAAVIAARRFSGNQCYYFLRNSYGQDCNYKPGLKARCEINQGGVWLTAEELNTAYAAVWIP